MTNDMGKPTYSDRIHPTTTNLTETAVGLNPGLHSEKAVTNRLRCGKIWKNYLSNNISLAQNIASRHVKHDLYLRTMSMLTHVAAYRDHFVSTYINFWYNR